MIQVSDEWKELHTKPLLPETFVEIRMQEVDDSVVASFSTGTNIYLNNAWRTINATEPRAGARWAWLEPNFWALDGSMTIAPDEQSLLNCPNVVSSDASAMELSIYLTESRAYSFSGFTIRWSSEYGEYATDFRVEFYKGGELVKSATVSGNKAISSEMDISFEDGEAIDSVIIIVQGWSIPDRRKRIEGIIFGRTLVFGKDELLSYSHEQSGDPTSSEISKNEIQFSLDNSDDKWNPLNPKGRGKNLYEQQKLTVYYGLQVGQKIEWVQAGIFYLTEWSAPSNGLEAKFTARDILGPMLSANCKIARRRMLLLTWIDLFDSIEHAEKLEWTPAGDRYVGQVGTAPEKTYVWVYDYDISSLDENIDPTRYAAWALIEVPELGIKGWGTISFLWADQGTGTLQETYERLLEQCSLPEDFVFRCEDSKFGSLQAPFLFDETNLAEYLQLCGGLCGSAVWQNAEGVLRFSAPSWELTDYVIRGDMAYSYPEVELAKPLKEVRFIGHYQGRSGEAEFVYNFAERGESIKVDNPYAFLSQKDFANFNQIANLFGNSNIDGNQEALAKMWRNRTLVTGEFRADPRLELFDVVQVETKFGTVSPVMITRIKYSYNGAFHGSYEGKVLFEEE